MQNTSNPQKFCGLHTLEQENQMSVFHLWLPMQTRAEFWQRPLCFADTVNRTIRDLVKSAYCVVSKCAVLLLAIVQASFLKPE